MTENIDLIPLRNNLLIDFKFNETKEKIIMRIVQLKLNDIKYKFDNEFLNLVLNLIEHLIVKRDKINKKDLAILVFKELFSITDEEEKLLTANIDYLCNNGNVKKVSSYRLFKTCFTEWSKKK